MEASRTYHGGTFLGWDDLQEAKINHRVELEYYQTKNDINNILNDFKNTNINFYLQNT